MNITRSQSKEQNYTQLDDERINKLIAKYYTIQETKEANYETNRTFVLNNRSRKKPMSSTATTFRRTSSQAFPVQNENVIYKLRSSGSDSTEGKNNTDYNIRIICDNPRFDSLKSHSNFSDSGFIKLSPKCSNGEYSGLRARNRVSFEDRDKCVLDQQTSVTNNDMPSLKSYVEKTTYCRPVKKDNDKRLLHKMMERNAKLQLLLTKFVIARQKEKEKEKWNNYVNSIKMRNRCYRDLSSQFTSPPRFRPAYSYKLEQSDSCREMLHDLYKNTTKNEIPQEQPNDEEHIEYSDTSILKGVYNNQLHCFSSTSRMRRTFRERGSSDPKSPYRRGSYGATVVIPDKYRSNMNTKLNKIVDEAVCRPISMRDEQVSTHQIVSVIDNHDIQHSKDVQTHITFAGYNNFTSYLINELERGLEATISENNVVVQSKNAWVNVDPRENSENFLEVPNITESTKSLPKQTMPVEVLESKLDMLISLFDTFVSDLKAKESSNKVRSNERALMCDIDDTPSSAQQIEPSTTTKKKKKVTIVGNVTTNTSLCNIESHLASSNHLMNSRLNRILFEELDKSNKLRSDIEAMLSLSTNRPCPVQVNVEIPTRECSTEITASLSNTKQNECQGERVTIEDITAPLECHVPRARGRTGAEESRVDCVRSRRIAVNTDPLGLLTLLSFSTEAVKQLLSLVPNLSGWQLKNRPAITPDYVCNICGAAFPRPSLLSAHILGHDLGTTKDCCVCQHSVDLRRPSQLFRCRYCGQRFTRAYCCELHQQACARRCGRTHEVDSGLAMLR